MRLDLGAEIAEAAHERQGREALVIAQRRADDVLGQVRGELEVAGP